MGINICGRDCMKIDNSNIPQLNIGIDMPINPSDNTTDNGGQNPVITVDSTAGGPGNIDVLKSIYSEQQLKKLGIIECQTCANRTYVDGSDDAGVSFKTPTQVNPEQSENAVMGHEMEHVANEKADAIAEGSEIIAQSVSIHRAVCPECGVSYVAGGVTSTTTKKKSDYGLSDEMTKGLAIDKKG